MSGDKDQFLSLKKYRGGSVTFGDNKKGHIIGVGSIGISDSHTVDNVFLVDGLRHNLFSISQLCDNGHKVVFHLDVCRVIKKGTSRIVLEGKRKQNVYICYLKDLPNNVDTCLRAVIDDPNLWHKRLGHVSEFTIKKLKRLDLVEGLPSIKFDHSKLCGTCVRCKQVRGSFKPKKFVSTVKPLELVHMDLCGPMKVRSRGGYLYVFVLMDDYSRYVWPIFLRSKDETFREFNTLIKRTQNKLGTNLVAIRTDHGTEFDNASFMEFCESNGIDHNFSAPRTPQQNGVVERMNRTLEDMS